MEEKFEGRKIAVAGKNRSRVRYGIKLITGKVAKHYQTSLESKSSFKADLVSFNKPNQ